MIRPLKKFEERVEFDAKDYGNVGATLIFGLRSYAGSDDRNEHWPLIEATIISAYRGSEALYKLRLAEGQTGAPNTRWVSARDIVVFGILAPVGT